MTYRTVNVPILSAPPAAAPSGEQRLFVVGGLLKMVDTANAVTVVGTGGAITALSAGNWKLFYSDGSGVVNELALGASGKVLESNGTTAAPTFETPSAPSLTSNMNQLSGDVSLTSADTFYDGPSLTLAAGTWLLIASLCFRPTTTCGLTVKLWDGSTTYATGNHVGSSSGFQVQICVPAVAVLGGSTTVKASAACNATGATMKATAPDNGSGNTASTLVAVRVA